MKMTRHPSVPIVSMLLTSYFCQALLSPMPTTEYRHSLAPSSSPSFRPRPATTMIRRHVFLPSSSIASSKATRRSLRARVGTKLLLSSSDATAADGGEEPHLHGIGVGIDLGTTNSAVAMMIPAGNGSTRTVPTMIEVDREGRTIPSVVAFVPEEEEDDDDGPSPSLPPWASSPPEGDRYGVHTGRRAVRYERRHPESTCRNVKRVIGTGGRMAELAAGVVPNLFIQSVHGENGDDDPFGELDADAPKKGNGRRNKKGEKKGKKGDKGKWKKRKERELPKMQKQLEQARDDPALLSCVVASEEMLLQPEQVSACVLRRLYDAAERRRAGGARVTRAVIGVPAYFTEAQRRATVRASELAGVPKVKLLPEPEAAALAYGAKNGGGDDYSDDEELILVFDLGGGTFDVSVLEVGGGVTEVLATVGNNRLGGADFDRRVAEHLSACAVDLGRKGGSAKNNPPDNDAGEESEKKKRPMVKDWYREGAGEVPGIVLRTAEEARKRLSNQRAVEVLVPLTEEGWRRAAAGGDAGGDELDLGRMIGPFDESEVASERGMIEDEDYVVVTLDRKTFESICHDELQLLLQPIREVAIMAGVLLPGEARPSFVENAMEMARELDNDGEDFWEFENEDDSEDDEPPLTRTGKDGISVGDDSPKEALDERALQQIQAMDVKAQKKAQQRGRKKARDVSKRERSFRKQKQSAMEEATTASLLGTRLGGGNNGKPQRDGGGRQQPTPVSVGNERVQEGIHGRPLSRVVLVGGATRMPVIARLLEAVVGAVPQRTVDPDEAVALGCAVQAGILDGENEGLPGGMQAVLSPMQAAVMRALAKKRGMDLTGAGGGDGGGEDAGGISGMMVVDAFDDEDDFD